VSVLVLVIIYLNHQSMQPVLVSTSRILEFVLVL